MITLLEAISPTARQLLDESYRSDEPTETDDSVSPELPASDLSRRCGEFQTTTNNQETP